MVRRLVTALASIGLATVASFPTFTPAASADPAYSAATITRIGWWSRNPAASAPSDGFDVSEGPDAQPLSVAAVEIAADGYVTRAVLTIAEAGGVQPSTAALEVCTTSSTWTAGANQPMSSAPQASCDQAKAVMTRNGASSSWAADVTPLLSGIADTHTVSLMVVPVTSDGAPLGYDVQFAKPSLQSEVQPRPPAGSTPTSSPPPPSSAAPSRATTTPDADTGTAPAASTTPVTTGADGYEPSFAQAAATTPAVEVPHPPAHPVPVDVVSRPATSTRRTGNGVVHWAQAALFLFVAVLAATINSIGRRYRAAIGT